MKYFRIEDAFDIADRWYLDDPRTTAGIKLDSRLFTEGKEFVGQIAYPDSQEKEAFLVNGKDYGANSPLQIPIYRGTNPMSFTLGSFEMPLVTERIAEHLQACCGNAIQLIPATVCGMPGRFEILNVLKILEAIDETHSEISWRTRKDSSGNEKRTYAGISRIALRREEIQGGNIFRLKDWEIALVVSENVKGVLEGLRINGIGYKELAVT